MNKNGTVNIHGKEYKTVAARVGEFREQFQFWTINTHLIEADERIVVMRAEILNEEGRLIASGYAEENRKDGKINATSALENCETSAIGRALAAFGLAGTEYASADEVAGAINSNPINRAPKESDADKWVKVQMERVNQISDDGYRASLAERISRAAKNHDHKEAEVIMKEIDESILLATV